MSAQSSDVAFGVADAVKAWLEIWTARTLQLSGRFFCRVDIGCRPQLERSLRYFSREGPPLYSEVIQESLGPLLVHWPPVGTMVGGLLAVVRLARFLMLASDRQILKFGSSPKLAVKI